MAAVKVSEATGNESADAVLTGVPAGARVIVTVRERDGSTVTVLDDQNGSYAQDVSASTIGSRAAVFSFANSAAGTLNLTVAGGTVRDYNASVWTGLAAGAVDTTNTGSTVSATSHPHGSITPSASALIITAMGCGSHGGITQHAGFTALTVNPTGGAVDRQNFSFKISHTGAITPTPTSVNTVFSDAVVAAYLESAGLVITPDMWMPTYPSQHKPVYGVVASGFGPPNHSAGSQ